MLALAIPVGLLIGLALGALGGGGSILTIPALVYLLGQTPHAATTGSLLIVGTTALVGAAAHWRAGRVRVGPGLVFGVLGLAGSYVGTRLSGSVDPHVLLTGFVIVPALVLALGFDMPVAVGTSLLVIALNSAAALAARLDGHPGLDWPLAGLFALTAIAGSVTGNRVASKVDAAKLTGAFVVLLVAVAVYTAARSVPQLV